LEGDFIKIILTKDQRRSNRDKKRMRIRKSRCVELNGTHCYTEEFNIALSLCRALEITFYFSKGFLEIAIGKFVAAKVL